MEMKYKEKTSYSIDAENVIIDVFDDWIRAAVKGNGPKLLNVNQIIGTNLLLHIQDEPTRMYYSIMFQKTRQSKKTQKLEYRCDSPTHRRYMIMHIVPSSNDKLHIYNFLIKDEPFDYAIYVLEKPNSKGTEICRCSICNYLKLSPNGDWIPPEDFVKNENKQLEVVHVVCPSCRNMLLGEDVND